jgi:N-acetylmuramoyl-L-alanine amidase
MPSSGNSSPAARIFATAARTFATAARTFQVRLFIAAICIAMGGQLSAQVSNAAKLIHEAEVRESALRRDIDTRETGALATPLLDRARTLVRSFEDISHLFASSPYGDDALWHGGMLAADAFWEFGQPDDRITAVRLLKALGTRYPTSSLVKQAGPQLDRLNAVNIVAVEPKQTSVMLKTIRREALAGAVRVTLELEGEATYHDEEIDSPHRVFIDLQNTRPVEALKDVTQSFTDDLVRQIRVGRQIGTRTRIAVDLNAAAPHTVYALYNPYRVVIDFAREAPVAAIAPRSAATIAPASGGPIAPASAGSIAPASARPIAPAKGAAVAPTEARQNGGGGFSLSRQLGLGVARIVIDPGHGGYDPGAMNDGLSEADLVLDLALRLEKLLLKQPGVEVVMTRRSNVFVPLEERTAIANREGADLFLSIHANASEDDRVRGIETYFLNFAPNPAAEAIAARENAASARTMRQLPDIVKAIALNNKIDESRDFASLVQASMLDRLKRSNKSVKDLGVKQAPFMVLIGATMPSILAEISFLTNGQEAALLRGGAYRQQIAEALFNGVMRYQRSLKAAAQTVASQ